MNSKAQARPINAKKTNVPIKSPEQQDESALIEEAQQSKQCAICRKECEIVDLSGNPLMRETLTAYCKMPTQNLDSTLGSLCVPCVYKINAHREVTRSLQIRLSRLTSGQIPNTADAVSKQTLTCASKATKFINNDTNSIKTNNEKLLSPSLSQTLKSSTDTSSLDNPLLIYDAHKDSSKKDNRNMRTIQQSPSAPVPASLLINNEQSPNAGKMKLNGIVKSSLLPQLKNPIEKISSEHSKSPLNTEPIPQTAHRSSAGAISIGSTAVPAQLSLKRVYHCNKCAVTFENIAKLREHRRIHLRQFNCDTCGNEYSAELEFDFHRAECKTKEEIKNQCKMGIAPSVRLTRARSRGCGIYKVDDSFSIMQTEDNSDHDSDHDTDHDTDYDTDHDSDHDSDDDYDDDDDDDDDSVADTMYTKRMRFTGDWVALSKSKSCLSLSDKVLDYDENEITTHKEYDLYLLNCLKAQIHTKDLKCLAPDCNYRKGNLVELLLHDYMEHYRGAWYHCKKCGHAFTSKVYLDYHFDRQNSGRYFCFKCGDIFEYQHRLDWHLLQHKKVENYRCNYCKFEFLTTEELQQHCDNKKHNPHNKRQLIRIHRSMNITNKVQQKQQQCKRNGQVIYINNTINISGKAMQRHRRHQHPKFSYKTPRIGDVLFNNQLHHNCWGWKARRREQCNN